MHAFLIIGKSGWQELSRKLKAKVLEFPLKKIDDVRDLNKLLRLTFNQPTLIVCENIHEATEEALNAFLKNLEEPQVNIYFALTAPSTRKVLPTIVSRCEIMKIRNSKHEIRNNKQIIKFLNSKLGERIAFIDKIKDRAEAIEFIENIISHLHNCIHSKNADYPRLSSNITIAIACLICLKANGNVNLQLTNFVISLV